VHDPRTFGDGEPPPAFVSDGFPNTAPASARTLSEAQTAAGAVWSEVADGRVARHFGDSAAEYAAVREAAGIAVRADRARIRLWGKDPVRMVQGLITNELAKSPAGQGVYAAMLTPKGRCIAELRVFRRELPAGVEVLLDLPREALEGTREHLKRMVPPLFAKWAEASDALQAIGVYGPEARRMVGSVLGVELPISEDAQLEAELSGEPVLVTATRDAGGEEGFDLFLPATVAAEAWERLRAAGARPLGFAALETLRVEAGRPRYGSELSEEIIPTEAFEETGLMERAISFSKGCYTGQEVIVRIAHRGHVNRHLRGLRLGDAPAPARAARLFHPQTGRDVGFLTSTAWSPLLGETVALGFLRRELGPGDSVRVGDPAGAEARVVRLPFRADAA
jgi:folate-binding protein YgfZ